jgi:hypothetical protein
MACAEQNGSVACQGLGITRPIEGREANSEKIQNRNDAPNKSFANYADYLYGKKIEPPGWC